MTYTAPATILLKSIKAFKTELRYNVYMESGEQPQKPELKPNPETEIHIPQFIQNTPDIPEIQAAQLAEDLDLPGLRDERLSPELLGLHFCRGRDLTIEQAQEAKDEAKALPRTREEIIDYFSDRTKDQIEMTAKKEKKRNEEMYEDFWRLEQDLLKAAGVEIPATVTDLSTYFHWIAATPGIFQKAFTPTEAEQKVFQFSFNRKYNWLANNMLSSHHPKEHWEWVLQALRNNPLEYTFYKAYIDRPRVSLLGSMTDLYPEDSLLFHTTSTESAVQIVLAKHIMSGSPNNIPLEARGGVSYSANGLTHPRGGHTEGQMKDHIAFVAPFTTLRDVSCATPSPETFREFEQEVLSPFPSPTDLFAGAVPLTPELFPDVLRTGYAGDTIIGGKVIENWKQQYSESGRMFTPTDIDQLHELMRHSQTEVGTKPGSYTPIGQRIWNLLKRISE